MLGFVFLVNAELGAQSFSTLYSFPGGNESGSPNSGLVQQGDTLYGMTSASPLFVPAALYAIGVDGANYTNLLSIPTLTPDFRRSWLTVSGNTIYGTTASGGVWQRGTVFAVNTDGTGFTNLHTFVRDDGANPDSGVILDGETLYGSCYFQGPSGSGTLFKINVDGSGFTNLYFFTNAVDGQSPSGKLVLVGQTLYGTTQGGGNGSGTIFAISTNGENFTNLYTFSPIALSQTNLDGARPNAGLLLSSNFFYGTTLAGGRFASGTVFKVSIDGSGFTNLHSFTTVRSRTNSDGASPYGGLVLVGNTLYGTTYAGGVSSNGTVFAIETDGTGFTNLYNFSGFSVTPPHTNTDGAHPQAALLFSGNTLYGTTTFGGNASSGTIFSLSLGPAAPRLKVTSSDTNMILTWPTNASGFTLQSITNLDGSDSWLPVSPDPVVNNGQYTVTNAISGQQRFYRLKQ